MVLRPIGRLFEADALGRLPRLGRAPKGPHGALAHRIAAQVAEGVGDDFVSVVLRGSVARGTEVPEASDLDLVVVTWSGEAGPRPPEGEFEVEVATIALDALRSDRNAAWMRFALAHSGWTLRGRDVVTDLPEPVLGPHCVAHLWSVERWGRDWPVMLDADPSSAERRLTCRWLMKRIVRSAFEGVMLDLRAYSRDIHPCAVAAARAHPEHAERIWRAAELAVSPTEDRSAIAEVAEPLVDWLGTLWPQIRARHALGSDAP